MILSASYININLRYYSRKILEFMGNASLKIKFMKRIITKIGDLFSVKLDEKKIFSMCCK